MEDLGLFYGDRRDRHPDHHHQPNPDPFTHADELTHPNELAHAHTLTHTHDDPLSNTLANGHQNPDAHIAQQPLGVRDVHPGGYMVPLSRDGFIALATRAATRALFLSKSRLACRLSPPVSSLTRLSRKGVMAAP